MSYLFSALQCIAGTCRNRSLVLYLTVVLFLLWTGITFAGPAATGLTMEQRPGVKVLLRLDPVSHATRVRTRQTMTRDALRTKTATINVIYTGFTPEAEAAFQAAVDYWETMFVSSVPITVNASWEPLGTGVLGGAGATTFSRNFTNAPHANTWYSIALANTLAGQDMNGSANEIDATFSSAWTDWYFGTDGNPPSNQIDFMSAVMHELGHGLGMTAFFSKTGSFGYWGSSGSPAIYDEYVVNSSNTQLISMVSGSTTLGSQLTSNNLYWNGASGMLGNGGNKPKLYAPSSWATGSSISHLDETAYPAGNPNSLMTPLMGRGEFPTNGVFGIVTPGDVAEEQPLLHIEHAAILQYLSFAQVEVKTIQIGVNIEPAGKVDNLLLEAMHLVKHAGNIKARRTQQRRHFRRSAQPAVAIGECENGLIMLYPPLLKTGLTHQPGLLFSRLKFNRRHSSQPFVEIPICWCLLA